VDPNQTLFQAVTGESFSLEWSTKPGMTADRGSQYYVDDPTDAFREALWAAALEGMVVLGPKYANRADAAPLDERMLREQIVRSLHERHLPAILIAEGDRIGEFFLVTGYEEGGRYLVGWRAGGGGPTIVFDTKSRIRTDAWFADTRGAILLQKQIAPPPMEAIARRTLNRAISIMQRREVGPYFAGAAMYEAWASALVDPVLDATDPATAKKRAGWIEPQIWDLAERRAYGAIFLRAAADVLPPAADELTAAANDFDSIHNQMWAISRETGSKGPNDPMSRLADPVVRQQISDMVLQAKAWDADALRHLEAAQAALGPATTQAAP
jgi:hypothetical protein